MSRPLVTIRETTGFQRRADSLLTAEELDDLRVALASDPTVGDLIPGGGGLRKFRIGIAGRGKRGGARVIYYYYDDGIPLYLIDLFAKNEASDLSRDELADLAAFAKQIAAAARERKGRST